MVKQDRLVSCHYWTLNFQCMFFALCEKSRQVNCASSPLCDTDAIINDVKLLLKQKFEFGRSVLCLGH